MVNDPLGTGRDGSPSTCTTSGRRPAEIAEVVDDAVAAEMFTRDYADVFAGDDRWRGLRLPAGDTFEWDADSTYVASRRTSTACPTSRQPVTDIHGARVLALLGDSVTTDHISPAGAIKTDSPAGHYLTDHGVPRRDFNSYGSRRGNHEVMIRGTFANIRLRNQLAPGTEGGFTTKLPDGEQKSIYDASREVHRGGHAAGRAGRQGVRLRLLARLGRQGHRAARRPRGDRRVVRADPPVQPDRHGRAAAAVQARASRRLARADRARDVRHHRHRGDQRRTDAAPR